MAMEKYGTDYNTITPTDDALRTLKKLCSETGEQYYVPSTQQEAMEKIAELKENNREK